MVWNLEAKTDGTSGGGDKKAFTRFAEGITFIQLIDDAPNVRWVHWLPMHNRSVTCPGRGCPFCEVRNVQKQNGQKQTIGMSRRYSMNVYNHDTKQVEIMEQGKTFFEDLRDLVGDAIEEGKDPKTLVFKVRRRGTGQDDTSYRIDIDSSKETATFDQTKVTELSEYFKPITNEQALALLNGVAFDDAMKIGTEEQPPAPPVESKEPVELQDVEIELE